MQETDSVAGAIVSLAMQGYAPLSFRFSKDMFKMPSDVSNWAVARGIEFLGVNETSQHIIGDVENPAKFRVNSFIVEDVGVPGVSVVVAKPLPLLETKSDGNTKTAEALLFKAATLAAVEENVPEASTGIITSGLLTTNTMDRDGDIIEPEEFDIGAFMSNPQLFVNHQPWVEGHNSVTVGSVVDLYKVLIEPSLDDDTLLLVRKYTNEPDESAGSDIVDMLKKEKFPDLADGATGLWVVINVTHPEIVRMVEMGELNAFSWSGTRIKDEITNDTTIDLMEVSLVLIPANRNAIRSKDTGTKNVTYKKGRGFSFQTLKTLSYGMGVHKIEMSKGQFQNDGAATKWLLINGFTADGLLERKEGFTIEVRPESDFVPDTFQITALSRGVNATIGELSDSAKKEKQAPSQTDMSGRAGTPQNSLPDAAFAGIDPGGTKDEEGKTTPRKLRHLPHHTDAVKKATENTTIDLGRLRNALSRFSQTQFASQDVKAKAKSHLEAHASALGIGERSGTSLDIKEEALESIEEDKTVAESKLLDILSTVSNAIFGTRKGGEGIVADEAKHEEEETLEETEETTEVVEKEEQENETNQMSEIADMVMATKDAVSDLVDRIEALENGMGDKEAETDDEDYVKEEAEVVEDPVEEEDDDAEKTFRDEMLETMRTLSDKVSALEQSSKKASKGRSKKLRDNVEKSADPDSMWTGVSIFDRYEH